jgi:hypothetical protein
LRRFNSKASIAGAATLAIHLAIFGWLWFFGGNAPPLISEPVIVELRESPTPETKAPVARSRNVGRSTVVSKRPGQTSPDLALADLSPNSVGIRTGVSTGNFESFESMDEPALDNPQGYSLSAKSYDEGNAIRGFLEAVYNRVNNRLIFDSIFAQYGHFGAVYIQFNVDHRGVIDSASIRTSAKDKILKVHAIRSALLPGLATPLKENLWLDERPALKLRARFEFLKGSVDQNLFDSNPEKIAGLALSFRRFTPEVKVARTLGQHLVNGGINYDLFAMYDSWEKYNKARERRRLDTDPFSIHKADEYYDR